ncbi:MAG: hypothetical protein PHG95_02185 [Patescibacteria group bacterium]|nr:hypothetical protein [Patescibacteria group bacterium]
MKTKLLFILAIVATIFMGSCEKDSPASLTMMVDLSNTVPADGKVITDVSYVSLFLVCENTPEKVLEFKNARIGKNFLTLTGKELEIFQSASEPYISVNFYGVDSKGEEIWLGDADVNFSIIK